MICPDTGEEVPKECCLHCIHYDWVEGCQHD